MFDKMKNAVSNMGDIGEMGDLKQYVENLSFPASKDEIIDQLQRSGAKDDIIAKVREIGQQQFKDQGDLVSSFMNKR